MMESASNLTFVNLIDRSTSGEAVGAAVSANAILTITREICAGNERAFEEFYKEYSPRVYRFLVVVTKGNEELARELHQRVMIKATRKMKVFADEKQLWAWLAEVARNCWRDYARKIGREALLIEKSWREAVIPADQEEDRLISQLEAALTMLGPEEKALLQKFYYEGMAQKQIGEETGRTLKAIQSELARIRKKMKAFILKRL